MTIERRVFAQLRVSGYRVKIPTHLCKNFRKKGFLKHKFVFEKNIHRGIDRSCDLREERAAVIQTADPSGGFLSRHSPLLLAEEVAGRRGGKV